MPPTFKKRGGSASSELVLSKIEHNAYAVMDQHFSDQVFTPMRGGGGMSRDMALRYQAMFTKQLGGNATCDAPTTVVNSAPNPAVKFTVPLGLPQGNAATLDVTLPDIPIQAYNRYYYPTQTAT